MAKLDSNPILSLHLDENRPFTYAHLVKFERPLKEWNAPNLEVLYSEKFTRYAYITDASYAINFDDGSTYEESGSVINNGPQTYHANKLTRVSPVQDSSENKISNFTINVSANSLDAALYSQSLTFSISNGDYLITAEESLSDVGFMEGDLIRLKATPASEGTADFSLQRFRINSFRNEGKTIKVEEETFPFSTWTETGETYDILQASTEITALTFSQKSANFVNRQVSVFKAFFYDDEPDIFIGAPVLLFSGIIATANYKENPNGTSEFSWVCKSHWGDFQQIRGRLGSDDYHRALNRNGKPNPDATIKPEYASDMGFQHSNNAVNVVAIYTTTEERYREVWRNKFLGTKKLEKYEVEIENEVDLRFNLNANYIPVIYGVRRVGGNPIFADLENNNQADTLYLAETLSEGPIQSILNIYIDDQPLVCISEQDFNVRNPSGSDYSGDVVDIACYGRADRGDVLLGEYTVDPSIYIQDGSQNIDIEDYEAIDAQAQANIAGAQLAAAAVYNPESSVVIVKNDSYNQLVNGLYNLGVPVGSKGIVHDYGIQITKPSNTIIEFKAGLEDQYASSRLSNVASTTKFKLQNDYFGSAPATNYWGANHKLLDTAYVVTRHKITPDQTTVPDLDYVIKGKLVESYNYDGSYGHIGTGENQSNFSLGELVTIKKFSDNSILSSNAQIIDKWLYEDGKGNANYRFRWDLTAAQEISLQQAKKFYMEDGSGNTWTMSTYDYKEGNSTFTVELKLEDEITTINSSGSSAINATTSTSNVITAQNATGITRSSIVTDRDIPVNLNGNDAANPKSPPFQRNPVTTTTTVTDPGDGSTTLNDTPTNNITTVTSNNSTTTFITVKNQIKLSTDGSPSAVDDAYNGKGVLIRKNDYNGNIVETFKLVKDYDGATRILTFTTDLAEGEVPAAGDEVLIYGNEEGRDIRPTTNFALILLDYIKNKRYGAGLSEDKLNLNSFLQSARVCDTQSDITLTASTTSSISVGDKFKYDPAGGFKWQGTIKEVTNISGNDYKIIFTDCIGKLTKKINPSRTFLTDDIIWSPDGGLSIEGGSSISSFDITRVGSAASLTISSPTSGNVLEYSLYDSDFIEYWKYLGWDSYDQRWATRHQGNLSIDTSQPVFDVIGGILDHFNGILAFEDGKFTLSVETRRDADKELFWNFQNSSENWGVNAQASITEEEEYITLTSSGVDPVFRKSGLSFKGSENLIIRARIRRRAGTGWDGTAYYTTDAHNESGSFNKNISDPTILNEWVLASWDMSNLTAGGTDWNDNYITGIRLDLGSSASDTFDIEWVSVGSSIRVVEQEDIIGSVTIKDNGLSKAYNSLSASILDPQNNFNSRNVSFFNSDYLKQDRGIVRSGNFKLEGITNYYNARLAVEQILNRSRFSRQISFTIRPIGLAFSPGELIRVKYPRFGWGAGKYFRIQSLTYQNDCLVSIVATEHDDSIYFIDAPKASPFNVPMEVDAVVRRPSTPTNVSATGTGTSDEQINQITISWDNVLNANGYEIWRNTSNNVGTAVKITDQGSTLERNYIDIINIDTRTTFYYWVRAFTRTTVQTTRSSELRNYFSDYSSSAQGTTIGTFNTATINLYQRNNSNSVAPTVPSNVPITYTFSTANLSSSPNNGWTNTIPSSGGPYLWQISQVVQSITDIVEINPWNSASLLATDGSSNIFIDLDNENVTVTADEDGNAGTLSISSTAAVYLGTGVDSGWTFSVTADSGITGTLVGSTYTVTALSAGFSSGDVLFEATKAGFPTLYKDFSISKVNTGQAGRVYDIITDATAIGYNPNSNTFTTTSFTAQAILTTGNGTPSNYSGIFKIYLDGNTTATYTSSSAETSTTFSSYTSSNSSIFIELYDNTGSILLDAETVPIVKDGSSSPTVTITSSSYTVAYDATGSNPSPSSITFTATAAGGISDPYFKFTGNNITDETSFTDGTGDTDTFIYTPPASYFGTPHSIRVGVSDGDQVELSFDTLSISALQPGSQGESAAELRLYQALSGGDTIPSPPTGVSFNFSTGALSNIPSGWSETPSSNSYVQIEYVATAFVQGLGTISNITFNTPVASIGGNPVQNYIFKRSPNNPGKPSNTTNFAIPSTWYDDINNVPAGTDPMWSSVGNSTATFSTTLVWTTVWGEPNQIEGRDGATVILTNEAHVLPTNSSGTVDYTDSGTSIQVYLGTQPVPFDGSSPYSSPSFRVSAAVTQGTITIGTISGSSNTVTVGNHTNQTTDLAIITYTITVVNSKGDSETYTKTQSISKSKEGQEGIKNETFEIYYSLSSSSAPTTPSATSYTFSSGSFTGLTSNWTTTPVPITGAAANNFWKSRVIARENSNAAGVSSGANLSFSSAVRLLSGFGDVVDKNEVQINIDNLVDNNNVRTYASYAGLGLNSSGYVTGGIWDGSTLFSSSEALNVRGAFSNVATTPNLDVAYGGTGEVNSNTFRNDNITVSQGASGVFTLGRGAYVDDTTTITKSNLGLNYADGATVGATWGSNLASQPADNTIFNNNLTVSQGASGVFTLSRGAYAADTTTITKSNLGLNYADGATVGATWDTNISSQPATSAILNSGITTIQTSGSTTHNWSITNDGTTTNYNPNLSSQTATFKWYDGAGTLLKTKTVTTTLQTSTQDGDVAYGGDTGVTMDPTSPPQGIISTTVTCSYNGVEASVAIFVIDMSGWTFKSG